MALRLTDLPEPVRRIGASTIWLVGANLLQVSLSLITMALMARMLTTAAYGTYGLVTVTLTTFMGFLYLGAERQLVRDSSTAGDCIDAIIWTALQIRLIGAAICLPIMIGTFWMLELGTLAWISYAAIGLALVLAVLDALTLPFLAQTRGRALAQVRMKVGVVIFAVRASVLLLRPQLDTLVLVLTLEQALTSLAVFLQLRKEGQLPSRRPIDFDRITRQLREALPTLGSIICVAIYMRIDVFLLMAMRGPAELAVYIVAVRMAEMINLVPSTMVQQFLPWLAQKAQTDAEAYQKAVRQAVGLTVLLTTALGVGAAVMAGPVIRIVFGEPYMGAQAPLVVMMVAMLFVNTGGLLRQITTIDFSHALLSAATLVGAATNLALNLLLIPRWGIMGSAVASVIAYAIPGYFYTLAFAKTRPLAKLFIVAPIAAARDLTRLAKGHH